jgi:membrane protein
VAPKPGGGWRGFIKSRFLSLSMVLGTEFPLLVSLVLSAAVSAAGEMLRGLTPITEAWRRPAWRSSPSRWRPCSSP